VLGLLAVTGFLFLSERFHWFAFNEELIEKVNFGRNLSASKSCRMSLECHKVTEHHAGRNFSEVLADNEPGELAFTDFPDGSKISSSAVT
jgi:hypothetical protein